MVSIRIWDWLLRLIAALGVMALKLHLFKGKMRFHDKRIRKLD